MKQTIFFLLFLFGPATMLAQSFSIRGILQDESSSETLPSASVLLQDGEGETVQGGVADQNGRFVLDGVERGTYTLKVSYIGYHVLERQVEVTENLDMGTLQLRPDHTLLNVVEVRDMQERVRQIGDTTQYNAAAFKVNPDASAQDLLGKLPGVVVQNGRVQAQGEDVQKVLIDGKEFFSDDPAQALQSLPAEIIDKVEIFDQKSEQSRFTGFDDGEREKTVNITTKSGKSNGRFGKAYTGYGNDERYSSGFNLNHFDGARRVTLLGNFNNINKQNFSTEDILGAMGRQIGGNSYRMRGGSFGDFMVGEQNGIITTNSVGVNYIDEWGDKLKLSGSYFFNHSNNSSRTLVNREYFSDALADQDYRETDSSESNNYNHRFNMRLEYEIDDKNTIIFRPQASFQQYEGLNLLSGTTYTNDEQLSSTLSRRTNERSGYNISGDLLYRHKFAKDRRTLSLRLRSTFDQNDGLSNIVADNRFWAMDSLHLQRQQSDERSNGQDYSANLRYTEPLGEKGMLMFDYSPSVRYSDADRRTFNYDSAAEAYANLQDNLSSVFSSTYHTQSVGAGYMLRDGDNNLMFRVNYQNALLTADQEYPQEYDLQRSFNNLLPMAMFRRKLSDSSNVRMFYRSSSNAPSVHQLQDVVDNTNVLQLRGGNPGLDQEIRHFWVGNYFLNAPKRGRNFSAYLRGEYRQDYIGNSTLTAVGDTSINGYRLPRGSQFTRPENMEGYYSLRTGATYGFPLKLLKSNLNLTLGGSHTNAPGLVNGVKNFARTTNFSGGMVLGSNISEKVDFTLNYNGGYNLVNNTLVSARNNNYFNHTASLKFNWLFGDGFVVNTDISNIMYRGLSQGINQNYLLWNAYFGYKFLKNDAGELRINVFDILGQNTSISRTITETYLEDVQTMVLQRYVMLSFTYTLRNFSGGAGSGGGGAGRLRGAGMRGR